MDGSEQSKENVKKCSIKPGDLMKAVLRPGSGDTPKSGDQAVFHYTVRTSDGVVVESTRIELGGTGVPMKLVLGKSKMIKGWEEGIPAIPKGEIAMLKMIPELHYGDPECPVTVPEQYPKHVVLLFEIEMVEIRKVKVITDDCAVVKKIEKEGEGFETAREPYEIKIWITGRAQENIFLSRKTFQFTFGKHEVPHGLEKGIGTMTRYEKSVLYLSPPYITAAPKIPEIPLDASELEFEIEVIQIIQVRDMLGDGRLIKRRIRDGIGEFPMDCPLHDSILRIHYKGMLPDEDGKVFYDTRTAGEPLEFGSGEGLVPEGLEMCVKLMLPGELALVTSPPEYAYDKFARPDMVPEKARVEWEVELISFEQLKDWTGFNFQEIMDDASKIRSTGNRLFKEGKYELAKAKYDKILREFNHVNPGNDEEGREFSEARSLLQLNVAACYQKMEEYMKCIEICDKVLETNPCHVKALYRRGTAYTCRGDFDEAKTDFIKMIEFDKSCQADATAALAKLNRKQQEAEKKARKQFKGLFDKKPGEISGDKQMQEDEKEKEFPKDLQQQQEQHDDDDDDASDGHDDEHPSSLKKLWRIWNAIKHSKCTIL